MDSERLFESDEEREVIEAINEELAELARDERVNYVITFNWSKDWEKVRDKLDAGLFRRLIDVFKAEP